ncbi:Ger(x)C family spore germination protein [Paenibacillus sedimenti]|uniref:Ger(X)C family spore germination protein n=1 Tax=Paenibacillus sedimenti TaxID=2770274 RepID=A0A926KSL0_9BACL|nr:Ger(x)C family spore germination protein [Paenibacillus sedimenti]MBD0382396.1 Ger(x)C family spore germination protein [Paenibacillus sedimenti]
MKPFIHTGLLLMLLITSGCWDRTEINDLAFVMGTALDLSDEGEILGSVQVAVPLAGQGTPRGGGTQEKFFVITAEGKTSNEVLQRLQKKLSRRLYYAHRSVVFVGEKLAKHGIKDLLDFFSRDPHSRLRTYIMVVKGGEGRDILKVRYPFEEVPAEAVKEMEILGSDLGATLRDLFVISSSDGIHPVMGVIESAVPSEGLDERKNKVFQLAGAAIFKDFKLAGLLGEKETGGLLWTTNQMKNGRVIAHLPGGKVGMVLTKTNRKIIPEINGGKVKFNIQLEGEGSVNDNDSPLDISQPKNLELVQKAMEKSVETQVRDFLSKVQKQYKVDVVGFGQEIYRNEPKQWKVLKEQWDKKFPEAEISIAVKISIRGSGMAGAPLHMKEKEIKK